MKRIIVFIAVMCCFAFAHAFYDLADNNNTADSSTVSQPPQSFPLQPLATRDMFDMMGNLEKMLQLSLPGMEPAKVRFPKFSLSCAPQL